MFGGMIAITAVVAAVARVLPICVGDVIFFIFGRRLWQCSALSPFLLFEQLKKAKEKMSEKSKKFRKFARISSISKKTNLGKFSTGDVLNNFPPAGNQNSLAYLVLIARTSSLGLSLEVLEASGNCGSFS
jgi:hypothetical protein